MIKSRQSLYTSRLAIVYAPLSVLLVLAATSCRHDIVQPDGPNLTWDAGPKIYSTGSVPVSVSGLGLNGSVDQLPGPAPTPVTITRIVTNSGNQNVPAGYQINETVELMQFIAVAGSAGFTPASVPPITNQTVLGAALAPGDSMPISFTFVVPSCGMFRETLSVDFGGTVSETNEGDNVAEHFFGIASSMAVDISVVPRSMSLWHALPGIPPAPAPGIAMVAPAFPATTATFTITATSPGTTFHYNYRQAPVNGVHGAVAQLVGPPPVMPPALGVSGPITITHQVTPVSHNVPSVDILTDLGWEYFLPKVSAITADGCAWAQDTAQVGVAHP